MQKDAELLFLKLRKSKIPGNLNSSFKYRHIVFLPESRKLGVAGKVIMSKWKAAPTSSFLRGRWCRELESATLAAQNMYCMSCLSDAQLSQQCYLWNRLGTQAVVGEDVTRLQWTDGHPEGFTSILTFFHYLNICCYLYFPRCSKLNQPLYSC